jgi:hypothetical protein
MQPSLWRITRAGLIATAALLLSCLIDPEDLLGQRCTKDADCAFWQRCASTADAGLTCVSTVDGLTGTDTPYFCNDIGPLLQRECATCHNALDSAQQHFSVDLYHADGGVRGVYEMAERIKIRVSDQRTMPPSTSTPQPTDVERARVAAWVAAGAPYCANTQSDGGQTTSDAGARDSGTVVDSGHTEVDAGQAEVDGGSGSADAGPILSFSKDIQPVFGFRCATCHINDFKGNLSLDAGNAYNMLVNVPSGCDSAVVRVKPGDLQNSMLYRKISDAPDKCGTFMPPSGPLKTLAPAAFKKIETWILQGAPNN